MKPGRLPSSNWKYFYRLPTQPINSTCPIPNLKLLLQPSHTSHPFGWLLSKRQKITSARDVKKLCYIRNIKMVQTQWKPVYRTSKIKNGIIIWSAIQLLDIYTKEIKAVLKRYLYIGVHSSIIHNSWTGDAAHGWMKGYRKCDMCALILTGKEALFPWDHMP